MSSASMSVSALRESVTGQRRDRIRMFEQLGAERIEIPAESQLIQEGERPGAVFLLEHGRLLVSATDEDGVEHPLASVGPGEILGEVSLLCEGPATATVRASEDSVLLRLSEETFVELARARQTLLESLLLEIGLSAGSHLSTSIEVTTRALRRELELARVRSVMASFLVYLTLGLAGYAVLMKVLANRAAKLDNAMLVSAPLLLVMCAVSVGWIRRSGFPREFFGLTLHNAGRHAIEAVLWSLPVLLALVGLKLALIRSTAMYAGTPVFPVFAGPFQPGPALVYAAYAVMVPIQEFMARSVIQSSVFEFLRGSPRSRSATAILVSNALFGVTHLHLTLTYGASAFVGGLLWGILYDRQRSLVGPCVSHIMIGVFALYLLDLAPALKQL